MQYKGKLCIDVVLCKMTCVNENIVSGSLFKSLGLHILELDLKFTFSCDFIKNVVSRLSS